jgi:murein DD-endopeptidase MepM/ murein hydrolase activator NlpD
LQLPARLLPWAAAGSLAFALLFAAGFVDWVRLRRDAQDVDALRHETARDQQRLVAIAREIRALETQVGALVEFERKIRLIADLPASLPEAHPPARLGENGPREGEGGKGGADEPGAPDVAAPSLSDDARAAEPPPPRASRDLGIDDAALERMDERAEQLAARVAGKSSVFETLAERLRGLRERLAATPSIWPTDGWVTSAFGWRISPFTGRRQFHKGLDISAHSGNDILAAARGRVVFAGAKGAFGRVVIVDHGFGFRTTYAHAAELHVRAGQDVERGQRLASVGSTGRSTGPHLHYAVTLKGRSVDPRDYILD